MGNIKRRNEDTDDQLSAAFHALKRYAPRSGYEQRFWARLEQPRPLPGSWKWLPAGALVAGLLVGLSLEPLFSKSIEAQRPGPLLQQSLPEGSLAGQISIILEEKK